MYEWDEAKREANLRKHGLDFDDADLVYENPNKVTFISQRPGEERWQDIALVERSAASMTISGKPSKTDWERIRRSVEIDDPIPYDANDPDDGPYDPNDEEAVEKFLTEANRINPARHRDEPPISKAS